MLNKERRRKILEIINEEGRGLVKDLASRLHTWQVTIRKDLENLHGD
jgi:DeoR/GlpR family transcriptional regulator of sugar metabolism